MRILAILAILILACSPVIAAKSGAFTSGGHPYTIGASGYPSVPSYGHNGVITLRATLSVTGENGPAAGFTVTLGGITRLVGGMTKTDKDGHIQIDVSAPMPVFMNTANIPVFVNGTQIFVWTPLVSKRVPRTNLTYSGTVAGFGNCVGNAGFMATVNGEYVTVAEKYDKTHPITQEETLSVSASTDIGSCGPAASCGAASSGTQTAVMEVYYDPDSGILPSNLLWKRWASPSTSASGAKFCGSGTSVASVIFTDMPKADCYAKIVADGTYRTVTDSKSPPPEKKAISGSPTTVSCGFSGSAALAGAADETEEFRSVSIRSSCAGNLSQSVEIFTFDEVK